MNPEEPEEYNISRIEQRMGHIEEKLDQIRENLDTVDDLPTEDDIRDILESHID